VGKEIKRDLFFLVVLVFISRIFVFALGYHGAIINEKGEHITPSEVIEEGVDMRHYRENAKLLSGDVTSLDGNIISPPVFPYLIHIFDYNSETGSAWPLSLFYLIVSVLHILLWVHFLYGKVDSIYVGFIVLIPMPLWFMVNISSDLIFSFFFALFFVLYFGGEYIGRSTGFLVFFVLLMLVSTRAVGFAVALFVLIDYLLLYRKRIRWLFVSFGVVLCVYLFYLLDLLNYFIRYIEVSNDIEYFGISQREYLDGLFDGFGVVADGVLSIAALLFSKALYLFGIRPSYGLTPVYFEVLRSLYGFVFLIGVVSLILKGSGRILLLFMIYAIPILMGASQDRYILLFQPLLAYYFYLMIYGKDAPKIFSYNIAR